MSLDHEFKKTVSTGALLDTHASREESVGTTQELLNEIAFQEDRKEKTVREKKDQREKLSLLWIVMGSLFLGGVCGFFLGANHKEYGELENVLRPPVAKEEIIEVLVPAKEILALS